MFRPVDNGGQRTHDYYCQRAGLHQLTSILEEEEQLAQEAQQQQQLMHHQPHQSRQKSVAVMMVAPQDETYYTSAPSPGQSRRSVWCPSTAGMDASAMMAMKSGNAGPTAGGAGNGGGGGMGGGQQRRSVWVPMGDPILPQASPPRRSIRTTLPGELNKDGPDGYGFSSTPPPPQQQQQYHSQTRRSIWIPQVEEHRPNDLISPPSQQQQQQHQQYASRPSVWGTPGDASNPPRQPRRSVWMPTADVEAAAAQQYGQPPSASSLQYGSGPRPSVWRK